MKQTYIVVASAIMILFCLVYQGTYSYFSSAVNINNDFNTDLESGSVSDIVLTGVTAVSSTSTMLPGESVSGTFSIKNPNSEAVCVGLVWSNVVNSFVNKNDLVVTLVNQSGTTVANEVVFPSANNESLVTGLSIAANSTNTYTITITYKNTEENQIADTGASFGGTITGVFTSCS